MQRRRVVRPRRPWGPWRALGVRLQKFGGGLLLISGLLIVPLGFYVIPTYWVNRNTEAFTREWSAPSLQVAANILNVLTAPPAFMEHPEAADETETRKALAANPLLMAIQFKDGTLRIREGNQLKAPGSDQLSRNCALWMQLAQASGQAVWVPSPQEDPDYLRQAICVLRQPLGYTLCRWRMGDPEVEAFLREALGEEPHFRVGLMRRNPSERLDSGVKPRAGDIQVCIPKDTTFRLQHPMLMDVFGETWLLNEVGAEKDEASFSHLLLRWRAQAYGLCAILFGGLAVGYILLQKARRRAVLELDRMASMAHSLKTPLGILMLRCDSIRLGQFDPARTEIELARICEDVERLTLFIDQSLKGFQKGSQPQALQVIAPSWFQNFATDLALAFEDEERTLTLDLAEASALANPASLRTALITLLENALNYATGPVTLRTQKRGNWLRVEVQDHGPGVTSEQLKSLGKPFMRFRVPGKEGFQHPGQGLGLFLLFHAAEHEGWGMEGASSPGEGLRMILMIPAL